MVKLRQDDMLEAVLETDSHLKIKAAGVRIMPTDFDLGAHILTRLTGYFDFFP